jgi:large subunit ribosomal protein L29
MAKTEFMKIADIRALATGELQAKLEDKRNELRKLRLAWAGNTLDNPNQVNAVRKDVARILTILRERQLAAEVVKGEEN